MEVGLMVVTEPMHKILLSLVWEITVHLSGRMVMTNSAPGGRNTRDATFCFP